jgi:hypothetical protein
MFKFLMLMFFLFAGLASCHVDPAKSHLKASKDSTGRDRKEEVSILPDTGLLSLKMAAMVGIGDLLSQRWEMEDADRKHWDQLFWDSTANKRKYPGISLFRDYRFTKNARCGISTGEWQLNKDRRQLELQFSDGSRENYFIRQLSLKTIDAILENGKDATQVSFRSDGLIQKRDREDPFYPANNGWRFKPPAPETNDQIRLRVKACVHFYALFFKDNAERHKGDISFIGLPDCFIWYNGGISLVPLIELDSQWKNCFYSEDQALKGYGILNDLFQRHNLKWPAHADSWVKETASVLEQMEASL